MRAFIGSGSEDIGANILQEQIAQQDAIFAEQIALAERLDKDAIVAAALNSFYSKAVRSVLEIGLPSSDEHIDTWITAYVELVTGRKLETSALFAIELIRRELSPTVTSRVQRIPEVSADSDNPEAVV